MKPLMSTGNRLHESLVDHSYARKCSGMVGKRKKRGEKGQAKKEEGEIKKAE